MRTKSFKIVMVTLILATVTAGVAYAGACLCVTRNMENEVVSFSCVNLASGGAGACSNHCKGAGHNGYSWHGDETCNTLHKKIKKQKIDVDIVDIITTVTTVAGTVGKDLVDGTTLNGPGIVAVPRLEVITGTGTFLGKDDTFEVPDTLGGGMHSTSAFSGVFDFKMVQRAPGSPLYNVTVTSVSTLTASMDLNGFHTGVLRGELNKLGDNTGEFNKDTGEISFLFSEILISDDYPDVPIETWSAYYGTCNDCLNNGSLTLAGDSFFISPWD